MNPRFRLKPGRHGGGRCRRRSSQGAGCIDMYDIRCCFWTPSIDPHVALHPLDEHESGCCVHFGFSFTYARKVRSKMLTTRTIIGRGAAGVDQGARTSCTRAFPQGIVSAFWHGSARCLLCERYLSLSEPGLCNIRQNISNNKDKL